MLHNASLAKKSYLFIGLFTALLAVFILALIPLSAHAAPAIANCTTSGGDPGVKTAISVGGSNCVALGTGGGLQGNAIFIYIVAALKVVSAMAGIATVGGLVWGGILYTTAKANASQVEKAKEVMINSIIGLLLFIFMYAILQFLVPGGVFS